MKSVGGHQGRKCQELKAGGEARKRRQTDDLETNWSIKRQKEGGSEIENGSNRWLYDNMETSEMLKDGAARTEPERTLDK